MPLAAAVASCAGVPAASTCPPAGPPPGPRSITQSAAAVEHVERCPVEAPAMARGTRHRQVGQELERDPQVALPLAFLAAAAADIEAEAIRLVAADLGQLGGREYVADLVEDAGVGGR